MGREGGQCCAVLSEASREDSRSVSEAKRTCRFLSGIINFIHFREACRDTYMEFLWQYVRFQSIWGHPAVWQHHA